MNDTPAPLPQDWLESGVDPEIIRLNVEAVTGEQAFELICGRSAKRRNDGRLRDHYLKIYPQYQTLDGWKCHGVDPQTGETMEWGRRGCFRQLTGYNRGINKKGLGVNQVPPKKNHNSYDILTGTPLSS